MRKTALIHISDIHYKKGISESNQLILNKLFEDLLLITKPNTDTDYIFALSGDVVYAGDDLHSYQEILETLNHNLEKLGIPKERRYCTPGNHDISQAWINSNRIEHETLSERIYTETEFNNYIEKRPTTFTGKFDNYIRFEAGFTTNNISSKTITGAGFDSIHNIGIYSLNTSLFSNGGTSRKSDQNYLGVDTRTLHTWLRTSKSKLKILIMHHPIDWLHDWAQKEILQIARDKFHLILHGHIHNQDLCHQLSGATTFLQHSAPPLFTKKTDELGYAIFHIQGELPQISSIEYRQWSNRQRFFPGSSLSGTDSGIITIIKQEPAKPKSETADVIEHYLRCEYEKAMTMFSPYPQPWIEPIISKIGKYNKSSPGDTIEISALLAINKSVAIKAPGQFGLTSLGRRIALEAWTSEKRYYIFLNAEEIRPQKSTLASSIKNEIKILSENNSTPQYIILDSWNPSNKQHIELLKLILQEHPSAQLIVLANSDSKTPLSSIEAIIKQDDLEVFYLLSMTRNKVRELVSNYNQQNHIGDTDKVLARVASDLETLNIHRTPLNCLSVLKASEADFDENPVNRTEILHRILFMLFNAEHLPQYRSTPDTKDCEFVLGFFCETLFREANYTFERVKFLRELNHFCTTNFLSIEVDTLFDILHRNHIIVESGSYFRFKFTYWIFYFLAHRMHQDEAFREYILTDTRYAQYPEIIEFYTGIDRRRVDAVNQLANDIDKCIIEVTSKHSIPSDIDPFQHIHWIPDESEVTRVEEEMKLGVQSSNLPVEVKDRYADKHYNHERPYDQVVREILSGHTVASLMMLLTSASRSLRNSDYVTAERKKLLFDKILHAWKELGKLLLVILPPLAEKNTQCLMAPISA